MYDIQEKTKQWTQYKDEWLPGVRGEGEMNGQSTENF